MANFYETVLTVLKSDERFVAEDGTFLRNAVYEAAMKMDEPFNFAPPFNYSKITTPQGCHSATLSSGSRTTEHIKQGLPKSEHDLGSPYFKPFSAAFATERAFSFVSKSVGT